ncbi:conserved Plasmodium protein, unknown function [Plasmodium gaboni]|uniref:Amine oxidase domain-containing protein n=1 Tax=Plasmodium gaboni TaxID=647221 RepID=A0ABY0KW51_9APIC|nr:conserved Plasmodium protein, unknown function [Plasmodium gaboni]
MEYINIDISDRKAFDNLLENLEKVKIKKKKDFKIFFDKAFFRCLYSCKKMKRKYVKIYYNNLNKCTYNVIVYDSNNAQVTYNTVVIVVPFGYEFHSLYATAEGNEELARKAKTRRLLLVYEVQLFCCPLMKIMIIKQNESAYKGKHDACFTGSIIQSTK